MKFRILPLFLILLLLLPFTISAYATESLPFIVDQADILTEEQENKLENTAEMLQQTYEYDIIILTIHDLGGKSAQNYADDYYDTNGYGYGAEKSGILFLLAMEEREWYISTCGKAIYALTDYGIQSIAEESFSRLYYENYYDVFDAFLSLLPEYFQALDSGSPLDGNADYSSDYYHGTQDEIVYYETDTKPNLLISFLSGLVVAVVVILIMRSSMNTKRSQRGAGVYLNESSFHLSVHQDLFLYSNVSKMRRQQNTTSKSGGGSSVHRSSSGRRHGGGGGRF